MILENDDNVRKEYDSTSSFKKKKTKSELYFETVYSPSPVSEKNAMIPESSLRRSFSFHNNMSSYLKNLNDYQISDYCKKSEDKFLKFDRHSIILDNPAYGVSKSIELPQIINDKWTQYYEK